MIVSINNVLSNEDINYLLNMPEVLDAKKNIDNKLSGSEYFSINLTQSIKDLINQKMSLDLSNIESIPMRWIKGDTLPHVDRGTSSFEKTYLMYLTDSTGELIVDNISYPITQNTAYIFNEGLEHKTINTCINTSINNNYEPRLLLGPMSEKAFAVGAIVTRIEQPGGSTIYIKQNGANIEYKTKITGWEPITVWPVYFENTDETKGFIIIRFENDITLTSNNHNFICDSNYIQFGLKTLKDDGTRPTITINGVTNYPGLIINNKIGTGFSYINIFNLNVISVGSTLADSAGWIGGESFGKSSTNNYIINCSSNGSIPTFGGGIVGAGAANNGGSLTIIGCSSSGNITECSGGIVGADSANTSGTITIESCWSIGIIVTASGGIIANGAATFNGTVNINNCYSTGPITGENSGGICGTSPACFNGTLNINNCYSTGNNISGINSGGIVGLIENPLSFGNILINNCYSTGNVNSDVGVTAGAIVGAITNEPVVNIIITHCYASGTVSGGSGFFIGGSSTTNDIATCYSEARNSSSGWNTSHANAVLTGEPVNGYIGTTWISNTGNVYPYELLNMGYSPYNLTNISDTPDLIRTTELTVNKGGSSSLALKESYYALLSINNDDPNLVPSITINSLNGEISTTSSTPVNTYSLTIYSLGSYNITQISLTVNDGPIPCLTEDTTVLTPNGYINVTKLRKGDYVITSDNREVEIVKIFKSHVIGNNKTYPAIIPKNSIASNYPPETFTISQNHLIKYKKNWIYPKLHFKTDNSKNLIKYYHIKLENYITDHLVINNGVVVESLGNHPSDILNNEYNIESKRRLKNKYLSKIKNITVKN